MYDIVVLTDSRYVNPKSPNPYVQNILTEDGLVVEALKKRGLKVMRCDWADPNLDWSTAKHALFRTTWDYFDKYDQFQTWLAETSKLTTFINSIDIIRWNMDKNYLIDLYQKGVHIPPTVFIKKGEKKSLAELLETTGWKEAVIKPTIAGAARHTYRIDPCGLAEASKMFDQLKLHEDFLLQEFQHNIVLQGEISLILIEGKYTHSVLKIAKAGDFRVQDDFGGTVHPHAASPDEIAFAENTIKACPELPVYARVDIFRDNNNKIALGELELIEPELWFREKNEAADLLAETIVDKYF